MHSFEIRGAISWVDGKGEHLEIVVRERGSWLYRSFEVDPGKPLLPQVARALDVEDTDVEIPEHVKRGLETIIYKKGGE